MKNLFKNTKILSGIVFENFKPMIPNKFHKIWKTGIESGSYFLKLCGSGGGGYILGFAPNIEKAKKDLSGYNLRGSLQILVMSSSDKNSLTLTKILGALCG